MQILKILIVVLTFINSSTAQQAFSAKNISQEALKLTEKKVVYDGSYYSIAYPNGDVPDGIGVCTDVIIRTFRSFNFDLQKEIHEDMTNNFNSYPKKWGLKKPDPNIDHRRVPNGHRRHRFYRLHRAFGPQDRRPVPEAPARQQGLRWRSVLLADEDQRAGRDSTDFRLIAAVDAGVDHQP